MRSSPIHLQVYVDETTVYLDGVQCLLYGAVVTEDQRPAIEELLKIRTRFDIPWDAEIKWNMRWGGVKQKAEIKEAVVIALQGFTFLVNISTPREKDDAFRSFLRQVHTYCLRESATSVQICFDRDCFSDYGAMRSVVQSWGDVPCVLFARGESDLSALLQYADVFAGAFAYMIHKQSTDKVPEILFRERADGDWMMRIDEYFYLLLRSGLPGVQCAYDHKRKDADENFWTFDCRDIGVSLNGDFTARQRDLLREFTFVFKGPMD